MDRTLANKREQALAMLRETGSIVVALSGGVDSAVLLDDVRWICAPPPSKD